MSEDLVTICLEESDMIKPMDTQVMSYRSKEDRCDPINLNLINFNLF